MSKLSEKKVIAITGSMGSGKSKVLSYLEKDWPVFSCDASNAKLLEPGQKGHQALIGLGLAKEGEPIDKKEMAKALFSDTALKKKVEGILHPLIMEDMENWKASLDSPLLFCEVPLLFESGMEKSFDEIWCVDTNPDIAMKRLVTYRNFSEEEANARLASQFDPAYKREKSQEVIYNNKSEAELEKSLDALVEKRIHG